MSDKDFGLPPEVAEIKQYVKRHFDSDIGVQIQQQVIIIKTSSAGLAGSLRPHLHKLAKQLNTEKRLIIRIG